MTGGDISHRLAVYGTLAPGQVNEHELKPLGGTWTPGRVRGHLKQAGWGAANGCPGIVLDPSGDPVDAHVLESALLGEHWGRLDAFEGAEYRRVATTVETAHGVVEAYIYELAVDAEDTVSG